MEYDVYLADTDNVFHQLRGHYLKLNREEHFEFSTFKKPEKEKKPVEGEILERKPMQVNILEARMRKLHYMKMRKKGATLEEDESEKNLQTANSSGYYSLDELWTKLSTNDAAREKNEPKMKSWRQLSEDEQRESLKEFTDKFKDAMDPEVWKELRKDLLNNLKEGNFATNSVINWHKGTQKILEISGLVINPACFYWN